MSSLRQRILREQNILGVICWLLSEGFPDENDIQKIDWKSLERAFESSRSKLLSTGSLHRTLSSKDPSTLSTSKKKLEKIETESIARRYKICYFLYDLLKTMCLRNPENQEYASKFAVYFVKHLGYGQFVSECLQIMFSDNEKLLYLLNKNLAAEPSSVMVLQSNDKKQTHISDIVRKLKSTKGYEQKEILDLLKSIACTKDQAVYINQDLIFKLIYEDKAFKNTYLLNINNKEGALYIDTKSEELPFESFFKSGETVKCQDEIQFLISQLELFASLSMDRNASSSKQLSKVFTLDALMNLIFNQEIPENLRATLLKLLSALHIDKEPRMIQEKPNLVRIVDIDDSAPKEEEPPQLIELSEPSLMSKSKKAKSKISDIIANKLEIESAKSLLPNAQEDDELEGAQDDENIEERKLLRLLKERILEYLSEKAAELNAAKEKKVKVDIFNTFTIEILRLVNKMIRFGLFNTSRKRSESDAYSIFGSAMKGLISQFRKEDKKETMGDSELEKLIKCLTPIVEYDESYFDCMRDGGIKRKNYAEVSSNLLKKGVKGMIGGMTDIGKTLGNLLNLGDGKNEKKTRTKATLNLEVDNEGLKDQIFKKPESLKKILLKFSNKTFTIKDDGNEDSKETQTKKLICEIFDYILDLRRDFLLENIIQYFKGTILSKQQVASPEECHKLVKKDIETLFPESFQEVGKTNSGAEAKKFKNYSKYEEIRSFDEILEKPFLESLLLSFFLTNSAVVQNSLVELLHRCCNEKKDLLDAVEKVELLFSAENRKLYFFMEKLLNSMKRLFSNSQTWLQLSEKTNHSDAVVIKTYKKLLKLKNLFEENSDDVELLRIKQRIFRHMGGNKILAQPLSTGEILCDTLVEIYSGFTTPEQKQKFKNVTLKVVDLFKEIHSIMELFCLHNQSHQRLLHKRIDFVAFQKSMNIGQIDLLVRVFQDNPSTSKDLSEHLIRYLASMIKLHGRKQVFLRVFKAVTDQQSEDLIEVEKRILHVLLEDNYLPAINVMHSLIFPTNYSFFVSKLSLSMNSKENPSLMRSAVSIRIPMIFITQISCFK